MSFLKSLGPRKENLEMGKESLEAGKTLLQAILPVAAIQKRGVGDLLRRKRRRTPPKRLLKKNRSQRSCLKRAAPVEAVISMNGR